MRQFENFGDQRYQGYCVHCGGDNGTRDHAPSKTLLERPLPENLPVAPACRKCNNGFSDDEEYVACLLECVLTGTTDPARIVRPEIARALEKNRKLQRQIESGRRETENGPVWDFDGARVRRVLLKQARGHVAFEINEPHLEEPASVWFGPMDTMTPAQRDHFEGRNDGGLAAWPEVGTRAMQRLLVVDDQVFQEDEWLTVQHGRYRYRVTQEDGATVRMVLSEYLGCQVTWD